MAAKLRHVQWILAIHPSIMIHLHFEIQLVMNMLHIDGPASIHRSLDRL